jgi:hypothetical protein
MISIGGVTLASSIGIIASIADEGETRLNQFATTIDQDTQLLG